MENTQYRVKVDYTVTSIFSVESGLKQGNALSPILFNIVLEKVIRELQCTEEGSGAINNRAVRLFGFTDGLDIIEETHTRQQPPQQKISWECFKIEFGEKFVDQY